MTSESDKRHENNTGLNTINSVSQDRKICLCPCKEDASKSSAREPFCFQSGVFGVFSRKWLCEHKYLHRILELYSYVKSENYRKKRPSTYHILVNTTVIIAKISSFKETYDIL